MALPTSLLSPKILLMAALWAPLGAALLPATAAAEDCRWITRPEEMPSIAIEASSYAPTLKICQIQRDLSEVVTLRKFKWQKEDWFVVVHPGTLQTGLASSQCFASCQEASATALPGMYGNTLISATQAPVPLHNAGVTQSNLPRHQIFLTVDLCPSKKPMDRAFFQNIMEHQALTPVAISLSGEWMRTHDSDLNWLKDSDHAGHLRITWINHTDTHPYHPLAPWEQNFILSPGVDLTREVLGAEIQFLKDGLIPSVFFRFPGLITNDSKMQELRGLGLIPMGANAWLARGQTIANDSVILVHANGNEPHGLALFSEDMRQNNWWSLLTDLSRLFF
jgi:hypothetical protein